jgi:hypothetical protein
MKILIIVQDLRVSGTSEGMFRSFIGKLTIISQCTNRVHYFMCYPHAYDKEFLQVARITEHKIEQTSFG